MRADGTFIAVEVAPSAAADAELARKLAEACPVDIFAQHEGGLELVERNLDECVLCRLCLDAADGWGPDTTVKIIKLYDDGALLS
ncbi:MAG: 4Fe-4S dicluster domain-containing protein [Solirubrobacteraceae bacterium]